MSIFTSRPVLRWAVPAAAAVAVIGAGVTARTLAVAAEPNLPPRTAAQLLVDLQTARLDGLSGTVVERADLGLDVLSLAGQQSSELASLVSGKHTLRVWYSGPDKARVSLLGAQGQSDVINNGSDVWLWNSKTNTAQHYTKGSGATADKTPDKGPGDLASSLPKTPQEAADLALKAIDSTTIVSTGNAARIAGRDAYELILGPRDTDSLVSQVRLAIDAKEKLPLRVQILAKGQAKPAFEVGFTQVSFNRPDDAQFAFNPPAGAKVEEKSGQPSAEHKAGPAEPADRPKTAVVGTGWTSVLVVRMPQGEPAADPSADQAREKANSILDSLPRQGGARVISGTLFSAMITDDGRILVGAVSPERLASVAADPAAALR